MFTGIIEGLGAVAAVRPSGTGRRMAIDAALDLAGTKIGDSIAVSGACLTVVSLQGRRFEVDVSPETLSRSTLGSVRPGDRLNLERALRLSDRIDGHLVSGHLDGVGTIDSKESAGNALIVSVRVPEGLTRYMIAKGSVAVDGISLTINRCERDGFTVSVIPHTAKNTSIGFKGPGEAVNIETDMIGKYVERFVHGKRAGDDSKGGAPRGVDMDFLAKTGFL